MHTFPLRTKAGSSLLSHSKSLSSTLLKQVKLPQSKPNSNRFVSTSPYGRTHVWKQRPPVLPNPVVPKYPQTIIRSDGSSFVQWTTSPKSLIRLTRDTTNNPVWNTASWASERSLEEESGSAGRMGRFSRRFGGVTSSAPSATASASAANEKKVVKEKESGEKLQKSEEVKDKEDVVDLSGGFGGMGMGGALDDVRWFEEMAGLTGGELGASGKGKKKEKKEKK